MLNKIIKLVFVLSFFTYFISSAQQMTDWTDWKIINNNFQFRYKCENSPYHGSYKTWFEFKRTDSYPIGNEDTKYGHVLLYIEGYNKTVSISIRDADSDRMEKVWHPLPFSICNQGMKYSCTTGFSKFSNPSSILNK